jgi:substrate import-associated zinc metallohydrolase lipoprotein
MTMKRIAYNIAAGLLCCTLATALTACQDDELSSQSVMTDDGLQYHDPFDDWLYMNYTVPYNIRLKYHMEDIESEYEYTLAPADYDKAVKVAHIFKYTWLEAYDEICGVDFTRRYVPKVMHLVGSAAYARNGTIMMGQAEGGMKITLYAVNQLQLNHTFLDLYFHTIHHEFAHILHQTKDYPPDFEKISEGRYVSGDWYLETDQHALQTGFVSAYAMSEPREDIAELTAEYITHDADYWQKLMSNAGQQGAAIIGMKLDILRAYMLSAWNIDIDELRDIIQRRVDDVIEGKII